MGFEYLALGIGGGFLLLLISVIVHIKRPKKLKVPRFTAEWRELQALCADKATWPDAVIAADDLLDKALKRRRFKGKSMGERMVAAQKVFSDNDAVWFGHNLAKRIKEKSVSRLKEKDVKNALIGIRQALKDLGALQ